MGPGSASQGHDAPWLVGELVPRLAAVIDDVLLGAEDPVRQPVVAHELPDVLDRVQLGRAGRQGQQGDVVGHGEPGGHVPARLVEHQHRVGAGIDGEADLGEVRLHGLGVGEGHHEPGGLALGRADRAEDVGPLRALIARRPRPGPAPRPAAGDRILLAYSGLVLPPQLKLGPGWEPRPDLRQPIGEVFLKSAWASGSWP